MHHNILSSNQLAEWKHFDTEDASYKLDQIDDYYNCMIVQKQPIQTNEYVTTF